MSEQKTCVCEECGKEYVVYDEEPHSELDSIVESEHKAIEEEGLDIEEDSEIEEE